MRSYMATHDLIAVSATGKETAINTEQTLDTTMLCAIGNVPNLEPRRETNESEATGKEEPDSIYDLGNLANWSPSFDKGQPQHFAFLLAYALGQVVSAAAGSGYQHTITPIDGDLDDSRSLPSFTFASRYGKTVLKRRFASGFVDSVQATFSRDSWCKITGTVKATGKYADNVTEETVEAAKNATTITLAANAVEGASAAERLQNVQRIRVELSTGVWTEVVYSAVSADTPAVISISAPGATADLVNYKILYVPDETAWMTFPARVNETPLRVSQMYLTVGGAWNGSAFSGGRQLQASMKELSWTLNNNMEIQFVPGAGGLYASRAMRGGRSQKISLNREFRDMVMQQHLSDADSLGIYVLAEGAVYDSPHKYQVELIWPKVSVMAAPISVDGKRLAEAGDLQVLEDDTYGSVIAKIKNLQATYAA